jgi:DNA polymerase (family X)
MPTNAEIARVFAEMAAVLEITGANVFRVNAYNNAARLIGDHTSALADLVPDKKALMAIEGIGDGLARKIIEFTQTGAVKEHADLIATIPPGLIEITRIPGVGPKTAKLLWEKAGITNLETLKAKIAAGGAELENIPRLGAKTIENIRKSIEFVARSSERMRLGDALPLAENLIEFLKATRGAGVTRLEYAGSLRRGVETIGDIDLVAIAKHPQKLMDAFAGMPMVTQVLVKGDNKCSVRIARGMGGVQVDLRTIDEDRFGASLLYFTGSKAHNIALREKAQKMKLTLNEYGLFPDDGESAPHDRGIPPVAARTEHDIYQALKVPFIPPEMREDRGEFALKTQKEVPVLIELKDIQAELHAHTKASDGRFTIDELIEEAIARGFHTIAVTDHSKSSVQANGLDEARLGAHVQAVREAAKRCRNIAVLAGAEVDILIDGRLDYSDEVLAELDIVIASPHASLKQSAADSTARLLKAIANPHVHIIGHPTGRMIGRRDGLPVDMSAVIAAAVKHNVALEINANHYRLDLRDTHVRAAVDAGCLIAINTDAHTHDDFDELRYGVLTARRGWLTAERCINAWPKAKLHKWLRSKR